MRPASGPPSVSSASSDGAENTASTASSAPVQGTVAATTVGAPTSPTGAARAARRAQRAWRSHLIDIYGRLDRHAKIYRPILLTVVALAVGLLVAPDLRIRAYPDDPALLGAPITENIKAPYDLEIADDETTLRLREDAVRQTRPVYEFDMESAERVHKRVARAFAVARQQLADAGASPGNTRRNLPPAATARVIDLSRPTFEVEWGASLTDDAWQALARDRFSLEAEQMVIRWAEAVQSEPIVSTRSVLEAAREHGLVLERVSGSPREADLLATRADANAAGPIIDDVHLIRDLSAAREYLQHRAERARPGDDLPIPLVGAQRALGAAAASLLEANLTFNRPATQNARVQASNAIKPVTIAIKKGEMIVRDGERLNARHLMVLSAINQTGQKSGVVLMALGGMVLLLVLVLLLARLTRFLRQDVVRLAARDLLFLSALFVVSLSLSRAWLIISRALHEEFASLPREAWLFCLPVAFAPIVARLVLRAEISLMFSVLHSIMLGLLGDGDRLLMLYALCGSVAATSAIHSISSRSDLLRAGLRAGVIQGVVALGIQLYEAHLSVSAYLWPLPAGIVAGLMAAVLALSLTPLVEWTFDYTTDLKLLELANLNHPALKELIVQAPGSYHHSIIVGALVEAAAESIGANSLLARVMAYYHDLGKGCNPGYFIENQRSGQNPHDKLKPSMSAMVIRRHVTDGIELAKQYGLGEQILAGIAEHHGNTLIRVFYHKACEQAGADETVAEADYRYPGTKPQTREAALVMLGDSIEAASRAMADPSAPRLQGLVQRIINGKFTDGQLDECDLTLRDLHTIAKSFSRVLMSIYHHRLEYPDAAIQESKKSPRADLDAKSARRTEDKDGAAEPHAESHLRRLGL